jgi:hypothetical protein
MTSRCDYVIDVIGRLGGNPAQSIERPRSSGTTKLIYRTLGLHIRGLKNSSVFPTVFEAVLHGVA